MFQSPCGGIGASDPRSVTVLLLLLLFQSPYGGIGASDGILPADKQEYEGVSITLRWHRCIRHDNVVAACHAITLVSITLRWHRCIRLHNPWSIDIAQMMFQSPYGGIGASDFRVLIQEYIIPKFQSPYGGIGASDEKNLLAIISEIVSITLRWHRCIRQVFINNDVSKPFAGIYERKVVKYIVNELLMTELVL